MQATKNKILYNAHYIADNLLPLQLISKFKENGTITPEEFVESIDFLILKCPTWSWVSGLESKQKTYLPKNKQFIVIKGVPCYKRYGLDSGQHIFIKNINDLMMIEQLDLDKTSKEKEKDDINNLSDFEDDNLNSDLCTAQTNIKKSRTYDITITYDNYYRCARVWLYGFSEDGSPLGQKQIFEDISEDYRNTTVTYEIHPHLSANWVSLHPCKHADTMKIMIDKLENIRVDQYMFVFLKFIQTVIPTIEYDWYASVG